MQKIEKALSVELFRELLRIRRIEEEIGEKYREQKMRCPVHLSIGQEAVAVGVCKRFSREDYLVSSHRAHAHYLAKGGDLKRMLAEIYGKATGCCKGRGGSMHLIDLSVGMMGSTPILGGSIPIGAGIALASKMRQEGRTTLIFFGEAATEEGAWAESLNFAALKKLPILFISENNLYSVSSPLSVRQPPERNRAAIAEAHGIPAVLGDGNLVEEVYEKTGEAIGKMQEAKGPCFLEFSTYRFRENCGPLHDPDAEYRPKEEALFWYNRCPIALQEKLLYARGDATEEDVRAWRAEIDAEIAEAFSFAEASPFPQEGA